MRKAVHSFHLPTSRVDTCLIIYPLDGIVFCPPFIFEVKEKQETLKDFLPIQVLYGAVFVEFQ